MLPGERLPKSIDGFYKSYALIPEEATTAIVFVHGFGGSPTGTWSDFHHLSREYSGEYPWWKTAALFFYKYDSTRTPIRVNAARLHSFLEDILDLSSGRGPDAHGGQSESTSKRQAPHKYESLLLVGHSEGAVVIRRMVLDKIEALAKQGQENNVSRADLVRWVDEQAHGDIIFEAHLYLFAPACAGTNFSGFLGFVHGVSSFFSALASSSLVRNELVNGSPILDNLHMATDAAYLDHPKIRALPAKILFGDRDQVVYTEKYTCDEMVSPFAIGHDHFSVCKPKYIYKRPLAFVRP